MTSAETVQHLQGAAKQAALRRQREADERERNYRAVARAAWCALSADDLRHRIGREDALRVAAMAGVDVAALRESWGETDRTVRQTTVKTGESWSEAYDHDVEVLDALGLTPDGNGGVIQTGPSGSQDKIAAARKNAKARHAGRAAQEARSATADRTPQPGPVTSATSQADLWAALEGSAGPRRELPPPPSLGVSQGPDGAPIQRTAVSSKVAPLASEPIGETPMSDVRAIPARPVCISHAGRAGERFCSTCGGARPAEVTA